MASSLRPASRCCRRHSCSPVLVLFSVLHIFLHSTLLVEGSVSLESDFDRQFLASPGTSRFFTCTPVDSLHGSDNLFLKEMRWTWNSMPLLIYDYIKDHNWYPSSFPAGVNVNTDLSGIGRIGLQNLSYATNGLLTCELIDVFGTSLVRSTHIRVLGTTVSPGITSNRVTDESQEQSVVSFSPVHLQDTRQVDHTTGEDEEEASQDDTVDDSDHHHSHHSTSMTGSRRHSPLRGGGGGGGGGGVGGGGSTISSDGHLSQADSRILKTKESSSTSSVYYSSCHLLYLFYLCATAQIFVYRFFSPDNFTYSL